MVSRGKTVPVKVQTIGNIGSGYALENIEIANPYVKITGEDSILNSIKEIYTENIDLFNVIEDKEVQAKLIIPDGITLKDSQNVVRVKLKVIKQSNESREITCKVKYVNLPDDFIIQNSVENIKVTLNGLKENLENINNESVNAVVDLSQINDEWTFSYLPEVSVYNNNSVTVGNIPNVDVTVSRKS